MDANLVAKIDSIKKNITDAQGKHFQVTGPVLLGETPGVDIREAVAANTNAISATLAALDALVDVVADQVKGGN